jgi:RHS repeat-associated protein
VNTLRYIREDHQGSVATILMSDGTTYVKESFTAFGARRSACTWSGPPTNGSLTKINSVSRHGYTWQTALGAMGLNDMNGRIQDAVTGRFLSADPIAQSFVNTQNFNRYSYVNNNPLTYADPSGFETCDNCVKPSNPNDAGSNHWSGSTTTVLWRSQRWDWDGG